MRNLPHIIFIVIIIMLSTGCVNNGVIFDTDRCPRTLFTHCEVQRIMNGTILISVDFIPNGTYTYNYSE